MSAVIRETKIPGVVVIDMTPSGEPPERWEMFPDRNEQRAMKEMKAPELAAALWRSGDFVYGSALPEIARNISVDKAAEVVRETLAQFPEQKEEIKTTIREVQALCARWGQYDEEARDAGYLESHVKAHAELAARLGELVA